MDVTDADNVHKQSELQAPTVTSTTTNNVEWLTVETPYSTLTMTTFGAHITGFQPNSDQRQRLFMSPNAIKDGKASIRGGVPICWPWFGDHNNPDYPAHGYVRKITWQLEQQLINTDASITLVLSPINSNTLQSCVGYNPDLQARLVITVGQQLVMELQTTNTGSAPQTFTGALHSYFAVDDIHTTELMGIYGQYKDKCQGFATANTPLPYRFTDETDRVHLCTADKAAIEQQDPNHSTLIYSDGHDSLVVWNPWQQKSITMVDMADDSFQHMLCVETAVTQGIALAPGERHSLTQIIA